MKNCKFLHLITLLFVATACIFNNSSEDSLIEPFNNYDEKGDKQLSKNSELILIIPDTQIYATNKKYRSLFTEVISRILELDGLGYTIKAVVQVGDLTDRNTLEEWQFMEEAFSKLKGNIEFILATGNHDYGDEGKTNNRHSLFSKYFTYDKSKTFIESFNRNKFENSYFQMNIQGIPFQIFSLEFGPRDKVVEWADSIANTNQEKVGILLTHAYLSPEIERYDYNTLGSSQSLSPYAWRHNPEFIKGNINDGQQLWDKLVSKNNFKFVFCGHRSAADKLISFNDNNDEVLQLIFAEHKLPEAIEGWIQLIEFHDDSSTATIRTYSTLLNKWRIDTNYQYQFYYN